MPPSIHLPGLTSVYLRFSDDLVLERFLFGLSRESLYHALPTSFCLFCVLFCLYASLDGLSGLDAPFDPYVSYFFYFRHVSSLCPSSSCVDRCSKMTCCSMSYSPCCCFASPSPERLINYYLIDWSFHVGRSRFRGSPRIEALQAGDGDAQGQEAKAVFGPKELCVRVLEGEAEVTKAYLSYPALYTHVRNKHDRVFPEGSRIQKRNKEREVEAGHSV